MPKEITVIQAAMQVGVTTQQIRDKLARGLLRGRKITPRLWLVDSRDLPADHTAWTARFPNGRPRKDG